MPSAPRIFIMRRMSTRVLISDAPDLRLDPEEAVTGTAWKKPFFDAPGRVEVEVGIGKGRFLLAAAEVRPDVRMLGVEWANKYLRFAEQRARKRDLENVRFARVDAREMLARGVPDDAVDAYYVFYPDPWPKKRHHKRRFFAPPSPEHLVRTLKSGGHLHVATDHDEYWEFILEALATRPELVREPAFGGEAFPLPVEEPLTNFEAKYAVEGRSRNRGTWRRA